jgi:hypothetical protein
MTEGVRVGVTVGVLVGVFAGVGVSANVKSTAPFTNVAVRELADGSLISHATGWSSNAKTNANPTGPLPD